MKSRTHRNKIQSLLFGLPTGETLERQDFPVYSYYWQFFCYKYYDTATRPLSLPAVLKACRKLVRVNEDFAFCGCVSTTLRCSMQDRPVAGQLVLSTFGLGAHRCGHRSCLPQLRWLRCLHRYGHDGLRCKCPQLHAGKSWEDGEGVRTGRSGSTRV